MPIIFSAVLPTILLLVLGNILRRKNFVHIEFWAASDKVTYFILFPALLINRISQVDLSQINFSNIFSFLIIYLVIITIISYFIYRVTNCRNNQFSSIYQGVLRFNSYVYFAIIEAMWGGQTLALSALLAGFFIPSLNICSVASFAVGSSRFSMRKTIVNLIKNPLIIATILGFLANIFPIILPKLLFNTFAILAKAALPLALLSVGAAVSLKKLYKINSQFSRSSVWLTTFARLFLAPSVAFLIGDFLNVSSDMLIVLVLFAAVPTATSAYILAKQLGGDADMMATIISFQTVISAVSLIFWLTVLLKFTA